MNDRPASPGARFLAPLERLAGAWYARTDAVLILLVVFVAIWTAFQIASYWPIGLHPDALESFAWSRHPSAGYYKHPPLQAFMTAAWFAVMPATDWSFHLLCQVNAALGLWLVYLIACRFMDGDKRLLVLLLLMLTPFYQFNAQRFATNQTLLSAWPLATYCFLRAFETRAIAWSAAAGAAAALAMLGKYFSIYLVAGLVAAALVHKRRFDYLKSPSPWVSMAAGLALLAPHAYWLATTGYQPFGYALAVHGNMSLAGALRWAGEYLVGGIGYMVLPVVAYALAVRPDRATLRDALWPADPDRRMLAVILYVALLLPVLVAPVMRTKLVPLWTMQTWFLLPILLLASPTAEFPRRDARHVALAVAGLSLAVLVAAPALAWMKHVQGTNEGRAYYRDVARAVNRLWHEATGTRLKIVAGDLDLGVAVTFYGADRPDFVPRFDVGNAPWVTRERMQREGFAIVCKLADDGCVREAALQSGQRADAQQGEIEVTPRFLGRPAAPRRFLVVIVPPGG